MDVRALPHHQCDLDVFFFLYEGQFITEGGRETGCVITSTTVKYSTCSNLK